MKKAINRKNRLFDPSSSSSNAQECFGSVSTISGFVQMIEKITESTDFSTRMSPITNPGDYVSIAYRGHSKNTYKLLPSIARQIKESSDITYVKYEQELINTAINSLPDVFSNSLSAIDLLALLQHHGIPTRLLDVTENPLVALYFACCSNPDSDGEVIILKFFRGPYNQDDSFVRLFANTYRLSCNDSLISLDSVLNRAKTLSVLDQDQYDFLKMAMEPFNRDDSTLNLVYTPKFVSAAIRKSRQQAQRGQYIVFPNKCELNTLESSPSPAKSLFIFPEIEPLTVEKPFIIRIRVPKKAKENLLKELKIFGISKATLFPDNADDVCNGIVDHIRDRF